MTLEISFFLSDQLENGSNGGSEPLFIWYPVSLTGLSEILGYGMKDLT
jgi:hypothetical protein